MFCLNINHLEKLSNGIIKHKAQDLSIMHIKFCHKVVWFYSDSFKFFKNKNCFSTQFLKSIWSDEHIVFCSCKNWLVLSFLGEDLLWYDGKYVWFWQITLLEVDGKLLHMLDCVSMSSVSVSYRTVDQPNPVLPTTPEILWCQNGCCRILPASKLLPPSSQGREHLSQKCRSSGTN